MFLNGCLLLWLQAQLLVFGKIKAAVFFVGPTYNCGVPHVF